MVMGVRQSYSRTFSLATMPPMSPPGRIAVFLPNWVGDVVMATPALRALREHLSGARITFVGRQIALETVNGSDLADDSIEDRSSQSGIGGGCCINLWNTVGRLRAGRFDCGVLLPNSFRTALLGKLSGIGRLVGYDRDWRGWMLTDKLEPARQEDGKFRPVPAIDYYLELVEALGASGGSRKMELSVLADDDARADELLDMAGVDRNRPVVMLNPGATFGTSKMWYPNRFAAVADRLIRDHSAQIIINAAPSERPIAAEVGQIMDNPPVINFAYRNNTIGLLKGLMRRCDLLITNDTGARHIAAASRIALVTIFGSTDPRWTEIYYEREGIVRIDVPCSPCQSKLCSQPPGPNYHQCMEGITPEMVIEAAKELLVDVATQRGVNEHV